MRSSVLRAAPVALVTFHESGAASRFVGRQDPCGVEEAGEVAPRVLVEQQVVALDDDETVLKMYRWLVCREVECDTGAAGVCVCETWRR